jgi:mRNA interferase RelE/StbE
MKVIYSPGADRDLENLDNSIVQRIVKKVKEITDQENPLVYAKALTGHLQGLYRFRVGDYRIIFSINKDETITILIILKIAHRKEVYK